MKMQTQDHETYQVLEIGGRFDAHETQAFRTTVDTLLEKPATTLKIDLSSVVFADSSALAELLRATRRASETGRSLILLNLSDPMQIILEMTALESAFQIERVSLTPTQ